MTSPVLYPDTSTTGPLIVTTANVWRQLSDLPPRFV